jgi:hypothetical protein
VSLSLLSTTLDGWGPGQSPDLLIRTLNGFYPDGGDDDPTPVEISAHRALLQAELQTTIPPAYTDAVIDSMFASARDILQVRTRRSSFSGSTSAAANIAILDMVIDRLATNNRDLLKAAISEISENGAKIKFANGKDLSSYRNEAESIIKDLKIRKTHGGGTYIGTTSIY